MKDYFKNLENLIDKFGKKCIAIGECGLDFHLLSYASMEE